MDETTPMISIIIVTFNNRNVIGDCLTSLETFAAGNEVEVIVVDNASTDGTADYVQGTFPWTKLLRSGSNLGFAGGHHIGVAAARATIVMLLNSDAVLKGPLRPLVELFHAHPRLGVVGARLLFPTGEVQPSAGALVSPQSILLAWSGVAKLTSRDRRAIAYGPEHPVYRAAFTEVSWVSGACFVTRTRTWNDLGGLDRNYFMYMEDVDYCRRAIDKGYTVAFTNQLSVVHLQWSGERWSPRALLYSVNSYKTYVRKFYGRAAANLFAWALAPILLAHAVRAKALSRRTSSMQTIWALKAQTYRRAALNVLSNSEPKVI